MSGPVHQLQILKSVVILDPVLVMNVFPRVQPPANVIGHDPSVFTHVADRVGDTPSLRIDAHFFVPRIAGIQRPHDVSVPAVMAAQSFVSTAVFAFAVQTLVVLMCSAWQALPGTRSVWAACFTARHVPLRSTCAAFRQNMQEIAFPHSDKRQVPTKLALRQLLAFGGVDVPHNLSMGITDA